MWSWVCSHGLEQSLAGSISAVIVIFLWKAGNSWLVGYGWEVILVTLPPVAAPGAERDTRLTRPSLFPISRCLNRPSQSRLPTTAP